MTDHNTNPSTAIDQWHFCMLFSLGHLVFVLASSSALCFGVWHCCEGISYVMIGEEGERWSENQKTKNNKRRDTASSLEQELIEDVMSSLSLNL